MPRPVHFEISADDPERALHFYQAVFGWKSQKWDGPQDYWLISTGENAGHQLVALQLASYLRAKGLVRLDDDPVHAYVLQLVGGRHELSLGPAWREEAAAATQLVLIGLEGQIDSNCLQASLLSACIQDAN